MLEFNSEMVTVSSLSSFVFSPLISQEIIRSGSALVCSFTIQNIDMSDTMINEPSQYNDIGSNNKKENNDNGDNSKRKHSAFGDNDIDDFNYEDMVKKACSLSQVPYSQNSSFECTDTKK